MGLAGEFQVLPLPSKNRGNPLALHRRDRSWIALRYETKQTAFQGVDKTWMATRSSSRAVRRPGIARRD